MSKEHFQLLVIGSGPAGCTAAIYGARGGVSTGMLASLAPGGQLLQTTEIENFPGFPQAVVGAELMQKMLDQAKRLGASVMNEDVISVDFASSPFKLVTYGGTEYSADAVIIASGANSKWLGLESEKKYIGKGVSGCATCDGFFYRGKEVCVIGGGDSAAEDALFLTKFASKVYVVHRRDKLRANSRLQDKLKNNPKIEIIYDHVLDEVKGEAKAASAVIRHVRTGEKKELNTPGVFIAIGHSPATALFEGKLALTDSGYVKTDSHMKTSVPGVFAAGDVMDEHYKQAVVAAGAGCAAAMEALAYLEEIKK